MSKQNDAAPDLPLGFGMSLAQTPQAFNNYALLTNQRKTALIQYIQSARENEVRARIDDAISKLNNADTSFF